MMNKSGKNLINIVLFETYLADYRIMSHYVKHASFASLSYHLIKIDFLAFTSITVDRINVFTNLK